MKRFLLLLLICLTCLNLTGGYAIAAAVLNSTSASLETVPEQSGQHHIKKTSLHLQVLQVNKETEEEDSSLIALLPFQDGGLFYAFALDFELINKHFLVHYGAAIKGKLPAVYLLHAVFRL